MNVDSLYAVNVDLEQRLLYYEYHVLLTDTQVEDFFAESDRLANRLAGRPWVGLGDVRDAPPQPSMYGRVNSLMKANAARGCHKMAMVISMAAFEMSVRRTNREAFDSTTDHTEFRCFTTPEEAAGWLGVNLPT